jgi:WD40 repeat protein
MEHVTESAHPGAEKLRSFGLGQLDEAEASAVEEHVSQCEACCRALAAVGPDPFTDLLRSSRLPPPTIPANEIVTQVYAPDAPPAATTGWTAASAPPGQAAFAPPPALLHHPRYRLLGLLGAGSTGAVYKAEDCLTRRVVALKVMSPALLATAAAVDRFRREVKAAARLAHPNIVAVHDAEQAGDVHFLVTEYVEGTDLARWVTERGPLPVAEACACARQCAAGLQHAHEHGMAHHDVKPHNLMRARDGTVKFLGFGLARLAAEAGNTGPATLLGTVDYLAPEQADSASQADIRSDIYSLGCTLYHLLSGRPPFPKGTVVQKIMAHTRWDPLPVEELRPDLPPGLSRVIRRMMAKVPDERYQTPAVVCAALEPFAESMATAAACGVATRPSTGSRSRQAEIIPEVLPVRPRRGRRWAVAVALLMLALVGTFALVVYRIQTDNGELVISTDNPDVEVVVKQNGKVVRIIDTKTNKEVKLKLESGLYELELKGNPEELKLSLDKVTIRRGETVVATVEWRPVKPEKVGEVQRFGWGHSIQSAAFSPDGRFVVSGGTDGSIRLWDLATGKELRRLPDHAGWAWDVRFTPDGKSVISGGRGDALLRLSDVATGEEVRRFEGHGHSVMRFALTADGRRLLSGDDAGGVRLWDVETGKQLRQFEAHQGFVEALAFAPDGKTAATGGGSDGTIAWWDLETGKELRRSDAGAQLTGLAFSPDGRQLLSSAKDGTLRWWDAGTGKELRKFAVQSDSIQGLALSADGRRAMTGGGADTTGGGWQKGTDFSVRLWDVAEGKELTRFAGHDDIVVYVAMSRDGRYALSASNDGTMRLWRLPKPPAKQADAVAAKPPPPAKPEVLYRIPWQDESQGFGAFIWQTSLSADGRLFLGAGDAGFKGNVRVFEVATGKQVQEFVLDEDTAGQIPFVHTAGFVPGGKYVAVTYELRNDIYLWDLATGKLARKFVGHGEPDPRCAVSPDGKRLLSCGNDKTVRLWDVETGKELRKLEGHTDKAAGVFSPDGKQVLTFSPDRTLRLWDPDSGKELKKLEGHTDACTGCFSPDGKQVLSYGPDGTVRLWDVATGKEVRRFEGPKAAVASAYFVANGRLAVARGDEHTADQNLRVWEVAGGKLVSEIDCDAAKYGTNAWTITASPDGRLALVSVKDDSSVRVLDLASGQEIHRFDDCPGARAWSFSPDGSLAVAGSFRAGMYVFRLPAQRGK